MVLIQATVRTWGQFESRKYNVVCFLLFKLLNTDTFIRTIYYNICMLISETIR